jgi:hypothetical protein
MVAVRATAISIRDAEKLHAHHEFLLAPRTIDVLKVSHAKTSG